MQDAREAGHLLTARHLLDQQVRPIPASGTDTVAEVTGKPGQTLRGNGAQARLKQVEPTQATCREAETIPPLLLYLLLLLLLRWRPLLLALPQALPQLCCAQHSLT